MRDGSYVWLSWNGFSSRPVFPPLFLGQRHDPLRNLTTRRRNNICDVPQKGNICFSIKCYRLSTPSCSARTSYLQESPVSFQWTVETVVIYCKTIDLWITIYKIVKVEFGLDIYQFCEYMLQQRLGNHNLSRSWPLWNPYPGQQHQWQLKPMFFQL